MKKFLSVVLAVLMCVLPLTGNMTVAAAGADATFTLSDAEGYAGDQITVAVKLVVDGEFNTIGFAGLEYDEDSLSFVKCTVDAELKGMCAMTKFDKNKMSFVAAFKTEDDDGEPVPAPTEFDGLVCTLTFDIKADAPVGETEITFGDPQIKMNSNALSTDVEAATVTVLGKDFEPALKFTGSSVEYDGEEHMIEVQNLPDDVDYEVEYTCDGEEFTGAVDAGEYEITAVVTADGYNKFEETATLTITEKDVNVTINVPGKEYDGTTAVLEDPELEIDGLIDGDDVEISVEAEYKSANAGSVEIVWDATVEGEDADNYNFKFTAPKATITKKNVTVYIEDVTLMIGDTLPAVSELKYTVDPELAEGDALVGSLAFAKGANTKKEATFAITGTFDAKKNPNYIIKVENGTLFVNDKTEQDIEVNAEVPADLTYGDDGFDIEIVYGDVVSENETVIESSDENVVAIDGDRVVVVGAGSATVTVSKAGTDEIADFKKEIKVVVAKKEIVVTAKDASKKVGSEDPALEYEYDESALVGDDTFTGELVRAAGETAKTYTIKQGTLTLGDNYKIIFNEGTFTIFDKTPQDVEVVQSYNKTYGDPSFKLEVEEGEETTAYAVEYSVVSGNVSVDAEGNVTILGAGTAKIAVTKAGDADYADVSKTVTITVAKKEITITAVAAEKYVDEETPDLEFTYDENELVGDDVVTGELAVNDGNKAGKTYPITIGTVKINDNYKINFVGAVLTVLAKLDQNLSLTAPETATFTETGLTWSVTPDGDYNEDATVVVTSSKPDVATVEADGTVVVKGVGKTVITATNAGNYMYNEWQEYVTLVVEKCPLVITVNNASKRIGNDDPEFTYSYKNFNSEEFDIVSGTEVGGMVVTLTRKAGEALGNYEIGATVEIENKDFYNITINKGTFSIIEKYPTSIVIEKKVEAAYGDADITFAPSLDKADEIGGEIAYKFASDNEAVVSFADENAGVAAVNGVGKAIVTITYAGNADYAGCEAKVEVVVSEKTISAEDAVVAGLADGNVTFGVEGVEIDFNKSNVEYDEENDTYVITNIALTGENAGNFKLDAEEIVVPKADVDGEVVLAEATDAGTENGSVEGLGSYLAGAAVTLTAVPSGSYKFECWIINGEEVEGDASQEFVLEEGMTIAAKFKKSSLSVGGGGSTPTRTITFVVDGDEKFEVTVDKGDKVKAPEAPEKEGFVFGGWYTDEELTNEYNFNAKVNSSMTLYAKWVEVTEEEPKEEEPKEEEPSDWTNPYSDVKENDWFYEAVKTVSEMGIMNGMKEGEFAPDVQLTRAMLVTMLYRIEGAPEVNGEVAYTDVNLEEYYGDALVWATENKIVNGVSETEFAPAANITREQIATIIFRYAALKGVEAVELSENLHFSDADKISDYAVAPMNWLVGKEIIKGYEDGTIKPQGNATRAEVATIVTRIIAFLG